MEPRVFKKKKKKSPYSCSPYRVSTNCIAEKQQSSSSERNLTTPARQLINRIEATGGKSCKFNRQHLGPHK